MTVSLGEWVRLNRERVGLQQWELAERVGYAGHSGISKMEHNQSKRPSAVVLVKVAEALGRTLDDLLDETGLRSAYKDELPEIERLSAGSELAIQTIRTRFRRLTHSQARAAMRMLAAAVEELPPGLEEADESQEGSPGRPSQGGA